MSEIRDRIIKILEESKIPFMEGTSNFMLFDSPNLAFTDDDLEIDGLTYLFSKYDLPSWFQNTRNFETHMIDSDLDENFAFIGARYGYYEGMNLGIVRNDEFEEWAYNNYDESDGMYYEYNSEKPISKEELRKYFDEQVEEQYQKGIIKLKELKRDYGGRFINVVSRASNGETFYDEDDSFGEAINESDMETTSDGKFKVGDLVIKGLNLGRIKRIYTVNGHDEIVLDTLSSYDAIEDPRGYKLITPEKVQEFLSNPSLQEGWKDNLKKAAGVATVAGGLIAGNANAANIQDPYNDRAPHPEQSEIYKDAKYVNQYEDKVIDKDGNEWTMDQWADLIANEDPFEDNDYPPEIVDDED